ncbi:type II restriction endonuclease, putative [Tepidicaulis marinus]|uniref:Type II restriction endonuclease, putative n=1 Tax=Tepidicaulis marinus TaxID=1333998 RepID=A0A081BFA0_9HYPH|nr:type II restriction endonuclease [Tepidicaulis marinus]GAK46718.1 type II restriction endonuclease, putative [Tepidicaulis marinus]
MKRGQLSDYFAGVAVKKLSAVETSPNRSNQHEFNASNQLRRIFGDDDRKDIPTKFVWFGKEDEFETAEGSISWYDARRRHPIRTEYRLYYSGNNVTDSMTEADAFFLALRPDGSAMVIVAPDGGTIESQLLWLFGLDAQPDFQFQAQQVEGKADTELCFAARYILEELGIEADEPEADRLDSLIEPFGLKFPTTRIFSELARSSLPEVSALDDPDLALLEWIDREEQLFRRLERRIVAERIRNGFLQADEVDVDGFLSFSLSVQNRRKSRAGSALENHLEAIFQGFGIRYSRGAETENRNRPDFLFPGQEEYRDSSFPTEHLTMLGSKSTLKDRWRQVLSEAERIDQKHLLTLEPGISEHQTNEMKAKKLQLIVPLNLQSTYRPSQRDWLFSVCDFLDQVRLRQEG